MFDELYRVNDFKALRSFAITSRTLNENITPILWRAIWLPLEEDVQLTLAACAAITRLPYRASFVRRLVFAGDKALSPILKNTYGGPSGEASPYPPVIHGSPTVEMERALRMLINLEHLVIRSDLYSRISGRPYGWAFTSVLDSLSSRAAWPPRDPHSAHRSAMPFRLKKLTLDCCVIGLEDFLRDQPTIEELVTARPNTFYNFTPYIERADDGSLLNADILPNLRRITGHSRLVQHLIQGRIHVTDVAVLKLLYLPSSKDPFEFLLPPVRDDSPPSSDPPPSNVPQPILHDPVPFPSIKHITIHSSINPPPTYRADYPGMPEEFWIEDSPALRSVEYIDSSPAFARFMLQHALRAGMTLLNRSDLQDVAAVNNRWGQGSSVRIKKSVRPGGKWLWMPVETPW
ncbi:hypothetical protein DL93DRAFT_2167651 [Clavulina sp. PMI_390]|nr:hypothetical protein DL93DRAFT_2167651 [Clavulina sp. PMI_390]